MASLRKAMMPVVASFTTSDDSQGTLSFVKMNGKKLTGPQLKTARFALQLAIAWEESVMDANHPNPSWYKPIQPAFNDSKRNIARFKKLLELIG